MDDVAKPTLYAISGSDCFDTINPILGEYVVKPWVRGLWAGIWEAIASVGIVVPELAAMVRLPIDTCVIRTPRALPFSFTTPSGPVVVFDQHLTWIVHRFARLARLVPEGALNPLPHFEDLYAERLYLLGAYERAAAAMASAHLYYEAGDYIRDLPAFASEVQEEQFITRSLLQTKFILGHELAHVALSASPIGTGGLLREWLPSLWTTGIELARNAKVSTFDPDLTVARYAASSGLAEECVCDALSLAAMLNGGASWIDSVVALRQCLRLIAAIKIADFRSRRWASGATSGTADLDDLTSVLWELRVRQDSISWATLSLLKTLNGFGLSRVTRLATDEMDGAVLADNRLFDGFVQFDPARPYLERLRKLQGKEIAPTDVDALFFEASASREAAKRFIGFDRPVPIPERLRNGLDGILSSLEGNA